MRKIRDYDSELKALDDKARRLKHRRIIQLGELVIACGAGALSPEQLAGALLGLKDADAKTAEVWRQRGAAHFQRASRQPADNDDRVPDGMRALDGSAPQN
ncbi:conjugal transfer protein TraD [Sphingomonas abietis]|uniref:Conjugal transfer protein TraD n=1 Tax=Sphingomonas abietis TaxID=3012344 RepID=A0ABY7NWS2_9SPHN|nr:conjugal transfer protein TraD [Sphingomonas abietis]WBO24359.1 conjugal transfer protein TraD [Sphingomonas abietis]